MSARQQFSRPRSFPLISHQRDSHHFIGFEVQRRADGLFCETKCFVLFYLVFFISSWLLYGLISCLWHWNTSPATKSLEEAAVQIVPHGKYPDLDYNSPL